MKMKFSTSNNQRPSLNSAMTAAYQTMTPPNSRVPMPSCKSMKSGRSQSMFL